MIGGMDSPSPRRTPPPTSTAPAGGLSAWLERQHGKRWFRWGADLAIVAAVILGAGAWQSRGLLATGTAPTVTLPALDGPPVSLASLRGKPVLLAFWAPWCTVCKAESGNLSLVRRLAGDRAAVISVAAAYDDVAQIRGYVLDHGVDYPVLLGDDALVRGFKVDAFPTVYFLDAEGRIQGSTTGYTTTAGLLWRLLL
jgi:thiol-disulfide isomerase/thioredoxin